MVVCQRLTGGSGFRGGAASISEIGELGTGLSSLVFHVCGNGACPGTTGQRRGGETDNKEPGGCSR